MKKNFIAMILSLSVIFIACGAETEPKDQLKLPLRITAMLEGSDALFTADIYESGCDITFDSRHALAGTELHFREDGNTATCGGFTREVKEGIFPAQEALIKALRALNSAESPGISVENGIKYTIDEMTIMVYYDKDTELLTGIGTEESGRRFDFTVVGLELYEGKSNGAG